MKKHYLLALKGGNIRCIDDINNKYYWRMPRDSKFINKCMSYAIKDIYKNNYDAENVKNYEDADKRYIDCYFILNDFQKN